MKQVIAVFLILSGVVSFVTPLCTNGWEPYENEKCFKVFDNAGLLSYDSAVLHCNQQEGNASIIIIHSADEQNFISNFLFKTNNVVDAVWIGARNSSITSKFSWIDSSDLIFTLWEENNPNNKTNYDCVQITPESTPPGKWMNEPCNKKNAVVCEKLQDWSLSVLQKNMQEMSRKLTNVSNSVTVRLENTILELVNTKEELENTRKQLLNVTKVVQELTINLTKSVPIGFVYVQLPNQLEPKELWPESNWQQISSQYSGHFFRVEGGNAAEFGTSQLDAFQGHDHEIYVFNETSYGSYYYGSGTVDNSWYVRVGNKNLNLNHYPLSNGANGLPRNASETRPVNYSVRVWKRI